VYSIQNGNELMRKFIIWNFNIFKNSFYIEEQI
jgi:hypothetical protein